MNVTHNPYASPTASLPSIAPVDVPRDGARMAALFGHLGGLCALGIVTGGLVYLFRRARDPFGALHGLQAFWIGVYTFVASVLCFLVFGASMLLTMALPEALGWIGAVLGVGSMFVFGFVWIVSNVLAVAGLLEAVCGRATLLPFVGQRSMMRIAVRE